MLGLVKGNQIIPLTTDTGTGAPIGTLIQQYKKVPLSGYLYCDGSTFDENAYPALYMYLGTNVLPDYRECVMVGAEENTTDTIATHDVYGEGEFKDDQLQDHYHNLSRTDKGLSNLLFSQNNGEGENLHGALTTTLTGKTATIITTSKAHTGRGGDTTHGKQKAVYVYIKATSGLAENQQDNVLRDVKDYVDNSNSYSTEEIKTGGTWIDGKPIYRKVYYRSETSQFQFDSVTLESGFANTKNVIKINGTVKLSNNNIVPLPWSDATDTLEIFITPSGNLSTFTLNRAYNVYWYNIIVEYTKTTD